MVADEEIARMVQENIGSTVSAVTELEGGVLNHVYRVETDAETYVLKHHRRSSKDVDIELPLSRYNAERQVFETLHDSPHIPELIHADDDRNILIMEHIDRDLLSASLQAVSQVFFHEVGAALASIVNRTDDAAAVDNEEFQELKREFKYYENIDHPRLEDVRDDLLDHADANHDALMLGDLRLVNIFVTEQGPVFIDFEEAYYTDYPMDLARLLAELLYRYYDEPREDLQRKIEALKAGFFDTVDVPNPEAVERRAVRHAGFHIIDQLVGVIKEEYDFIEDRYAMRRRAESLILDTETVTESLLL